MWISSTITRGFAHADEEPAASRPDRPAGVPGTIGFKRSERGESTGCVSQCPVRTGKRAARHLSENGNTPKVAKSWLPGSSFSTIRPGAITAPVIRLDFAWMWVELGVADLGY